MEKSFAIFCSLLFLTSCGGSATTMARSLTAGFSDVRVEI